MIRVSSGLSGGFVSPALPYPDDPLLRALAEYWDDVRRLADEEQRELLRRLVEGTAEPDPVDARAALADLLVDLLPADHPMVPLLRVGGLFSEGGSEAENNALALSWSRLGALVLWHASPENGDRSASRWQPRQAADLSDLDRQVQARLLSLPFLSPHELRARHVDPDDAGLIRLTGPGGAVQLPTFQFTAAGEPWPTVQEVNRQLDAAADPWGVTCWWVDPHAGLAGPPAGLIGEGRDELLRRAAAAVGAA
jgi:hypothetical protein